MTQRREEEEQPAPAEEEQDFLSSLLESSYRTLRPGEGELRHDTEGWRCLESSLRALGAVMGACGPAFLPHLTTELRALVYRVLLHQSRCVRRLLACITSLQSSLFYDCE